MPFWDHVNELARRLKIILYVMVVSTIFFMVVPSNLQSPGSMFSFYDPLVALVLREIRAQVLPRSVTLIGYELTAPMELYLIASFVFGFAVTIPVLAYEIYAFVDPALHPHERSAVYPFVASFTALFVVGALFGFLVLLPFTLWALFVFFATVGAAPVISIMDFYNMVFIMTIFTGLAFTWPVFFVLLARFGIAKSSMLSKNRKYVYAIMYVVTAFVTPDGGPLADLLLFLPMVALTEAAIFFARRYDKSRPQAVQTDAVNRCRFCNAELELGKAFCDSCGKAQL
jgi:sec-independent protein translocase protein TatC